MMFPLVQAHVQGSLPGSPFRFQADVPTINEWRVWRVVRFIRYYMVCMNPGL